MPHAGWHGAYPSSSGRGTSQEQQRQGCTGTWGRPQGAHQAVADVRLGLAPLAGDGCTPGAATRVLLLLLLLQLLLRPGLPLLRLLRVAHRHRDCCLLVRRLQLLLLLLVVVRQLLLVVVVRQLLLVEVVRQLLLLVVRQLLVVVRILLLLLPARQLLLLLLLMLEEANRLEHWHQVRRGLGRWCHAVAASRPLCSGQRR